MSNYKGYKFNKEFEDISFVTKSKKRKYLNSYVCLDTETSHNHKEETPQTWVYQWSFSFNGGLYYGRTPVELCIKLQEIAKFYKLNENNRLIVFVHNLAYDFSYLHLFFEEYFGQHTGLLAYANHKVFNVSYANGLEFRCSYKLSNDSLDRWGKSLVIKYKKLSGTIDYQKIRYQNTPLYKKDWRYMFYDVISLDNCIKAQMELYNERSIADLPLTSTGYVRREMLREYKGKVGKYATKEMKHFQGCALTLETYKVLCEEFSGGITHGNRHYINKTVDIENIRNKYRKEGYDEEYVSQIIIKHRDFRSHYPSCQRVNLFPSGKFTLFTYNTTLEQLKKYTKDYAIIVEIELKDIYLKDIKTPIPYLQLSHCLRHLYKDSEYIDDNGRLLALKGITRMYLDMNELEIIERQYNFKYKIYRTWASRLGQLPAFMIKVIDRAFKDKSDFKDKINQAKKNGADKDTILALEKDLLKAKALLNGIYGCSATNPCREDVELNGIEWHTERMNDSILEDKLNEYYFGKSWRNHCMQFEMGCYCTIYARKELIEYCDIIGSENVLYCDTDSAFYISTPEIEERIEELNKVKYNNAINCGAYIVRDNGKILTYDVFTDEEEVITQFRFLHAKCYSYVTDIAYIKSKGKCESELHSVIAGVTAKGKKGFREDELQCIDNLTDNFTFTDCGGTKAKYVESEVHLYNGNITAGGCIISDTTKTLSSINYSEREELDFYVKL